ncbi:twin-arginine translocase subunit TatC [Thiomicrorhabdus sp. Milos-T2]|uniref:twin-arginine translocase subunit TatC n=1 Tax=Thiomicrorhabdus sp. Milos-T2 TaxID=90814 RepID=UPI000494C4BB|nr:twin-arginine translocase subunit TatC [Thiomicrorhabdus sp. Milos-T2]
MSNAALPPNDQEMTLVQHLLDLKTSLTRSILAIIVFFLILFPFANEIYTYISEPLTRYLPEGTSMIATAVASPFLTPFKLSFVLSIYLAMPYLLYQLWRFIAPALYQHERQLVAPLLFFSSFLFYAGGLFAYYVVFPLVFGFLSQTAPEGVTIATDISLYLDFVIKMFFAFGMAFEVPIVTILLIVSGMTQPEKLSHARPYIVVGAFVIGMLLTPPDIISQTLLAVPMWLLFELGLLIGTIVKKRRSKNKTLNEDADEDADEAFDANDETAKTPVTPSAPKQSNSAATDSEAEFDFDDRYADQVEDDLDWDAEFDNIDSEMHKLEQDYEARQKAEKDAKNNTESSDKSDDESNQPSEKNSTDEVSEQTSNDSTADSNVANKDKPDSKN